MEHRSIEEAVQRAAYVGCEIATVTPDIEEAVKAARMMLSPEINDDCRVHVEREHQLGGKVKVRVSYTPPGAYSHEEEGTVIR